MMNSPQSQPASPPEQDLELLSAYLDNQLTGPERVNLERRLGAEPRLRRELDELRATTAALRELEPLPLPRSFTLDPATVGRRRGFAPVAWFLQLGSGLAGLALVLLATAQMLAPAATPAAAPLSTQVVSEAAGMAAMAPTAAPAAEMRTQDAPAAAGLPESAPAATSAPEATAAPAAPATGMVESTPAPTLGPDAVAGAAVMVAESSPGPATDTSAANADAPPPADAPAPAPAPQVAPTSPISPALTLTLGVILIGLAAGWYALGRR